jgi:uncharacterized cupin superfamily protein
VDLKPSPIKPSWIIEGNPEARSHRLSASVCGTATTLIWSCTEGKFSMDRFAAWIAPRIT